MQAILQEIIVNHTEDNMNGKGDKRRPQQVDQQTYSDNYDRIFKKKKKTVKEIGGRKGPEPTRYGDWEQKGRCIDF